MSKRGKTVKYTENPELGELVVIEDFLPKPEELIFREDDVNVTLMLTPASVEYFESLSKVHGVPYQSIIRELLDRYVKGQAERTISISGID
jgi:predicted DNA binding CopG/RHH family protein